MNALPVLNGYIGYLFTSQPLILEPSAKVRFGELVDRFYINHQPITHPQKVDDVKKPYVSKGLFTYLVNCARESCSPEQSMRQYS